jgi:alkanesulfonate monooxygenase SsuD/methylene tetrahydromethanopterin reductase-like flavin-dependent oxidoreductase (luciferase family)
VPDTRPSLHLGVDLTDAGAHPAAWRTVPAAAHGWFDPRRTAELLATAQRGLLDLAVLDDDHVLQEAPAGGLQGRLDAVLLAAHLAPRSAGIGLVARTDTTHTEPFHVSKAIATVDHVSRGRAGWQVGWSTGPAQAAAFGRKDPQDHDDAVDEAAEVAHVVGLLWDSWEDDAVIRDVATGRYVDRDKLHRVDHAGPRFSVAGPSITPRPPQGRPPVVVPVTSDATLALAARHADVVRLRATDVSAARAQRDRLHEQAVAAGRDPRDLRVLVDTSLLLADDRSSAAARLAVLDDLAGEPWRPASLTHVGTPADLAAVLDAWREVVDGFHLLPAVLPTDLDAVVDGLVPLLQDAGLFRTSYPGTTLRDTLGLARPANVLAATA